VKIPTYVDDKDVLVIYPDKYTKILPEAEAGIKAVIGPHKYKEFFNLVNTIKVKDTSDEALTKLIKMVGAENFSKFFEVEQVIAPKPTFHQRKILEFSDETLARLELAGVKSYKPQIKTK
jgi:hypothetical protein